MFVSQIVLSYLNLPHWMGDDSTDVDLFLWGYHRRSRNVGNDREKELNLSLARLQDKVGGNNGIQQS